MQPQNIIEFVEELRQRQRLQPQDDALEKTVTWKGFDLSYTNVKIIIQELETQKYWFQTRKNKLQRSGEIINLTTLTTGVATIFTGGILLLFPSIAPAGIVTGIAGVGIMGVGRILGNGLLKMGEADNRQLLRQLNEALDSLGVLLPETES